MLLATVENKDETWVEWRYQKSKIYMLRFLTCVFLLHLNYLLLFEISYSIALYLSLKPYIEVRIFLSLIQLMKTFWKILYNGTIVFILNFQTIQEMYTHMYLRQNISDYNTATQIPPSYYCIIQSFEYDCIKYKRMKILIYFILGCWNPLIN